MVRVSAYILLVALFNTTLSQYAFAANLIVKELTVYAEKDSSLALSSYQTLESKSVVESSREFVNSLKADEDLSAFFSNGWFFLYHEDNRCDGSTDGHIDGLLAVKIDETIVLSVINDGDGWACEKKDAKSFFLDFNLRAMLKSWDRIETPSIENLREHVIYIYGKGESDYLKLHYNKSFLIEKLEYRSEDPG